MKIRAIYYIAAGLALALTVSVCDGLKTVDKYSKLTGQYEEALKAQKALVAEKDKAIVVQQAAIAELDKKLYTSAQVIGQMTTAIGQAQASEAAAAAESAKLKADVQPVIDANPKLKAFVFSLESRLAQKDGIILTLEARDVERVKQIAAWQGKYDAQVVISESWKAQYEGANRLLTISADLNKSLIRKVKTQTILGNIKTGAVVAAAGYIIFNAIKGK